MRTETYELDLGDLVLTTMADPAFGVQARTLLTTCAALRNTPQGLDDGTVVQFGGPLFVVRRHDRELRICQPTYADPDADPNPDVSTSLSVLVQQIAFADEVGVEPVECPWNRHVVAPTDLDWSAGLYLQRDEPANPNDSGWSIGPTETGAGPNLHAVPIPQLLTRRPVAMVPLLLPVGTIALIDGDEVTGVADANDNEIWAP